LIVSSLVLLPVEPALRRARRRHFLMCPPTHFDVTYAINPWMHPEVPVDSVLALSQWSALVQSYRSHGHVVDELEPVPGLPDMVFAANGATVVDGQVLTARFANRQRRAEAGYHRAWHASHGSDCGETALRPARAVNEAEGDFAVLSDRILAGYGFRTRRSAHRELAALTGRPVLSLELVDPRFYHLDVALTVLDDERDHLAYYPAAFSRHSQRLLAEQFPDALLADDSDARVLGLNCVSDGRNVWVPAGAEQLSARLAEAGYESLPVDLSELLKGGGSVKCCTQEIRPSVVSTATIAATATIHHAGIGATNHDETTLDETTTTRPTATRSRGPL
jgi:N-dimethylarginine dimethylaminohydrolase